MDYSQSDLLTDALGHITRLSYNYLGRSTINDFQCGRWGWGLFNTAMAISDLFLVKSIVQGFARGAWKFGNTKWSGWGGVREWLNTTGRSRYPFQHFHHWVFERNEGIGRYVPNFIKNQPWNVVGMPRWAHTANNQNLVHQAIHNKGVLRQWRIPLTLWYANPHWFKAGLGSVFGRFIENQWGQNNDTNAQCQCS